MSMRLRNSLAKAYVALLIFVIYLPIIVMIILSFKSSPKVSFPIGSFSLHWYIGEWKGYEYQAYQPIAHYPQFWKALGNSLSIGIVSGLLTCLIVTSTALALRHRVRGRDALFYLILLGFITPGIIVGLGSLIFYKYIGLKLSFWSPVAVDVVFAVPFGLILMMARFDPNLMEYEVAASVSKADPVQVFRYVTLPLIRWEVLSAGILGVLLSWSELIRSQFVIKGLGTLATFIKAELGANPLTARWFAGGTIIAVVSFVALIIQGYLLTRRK